MTAKASEYEEIRRKRLEENKKRMEALNLPNLSQALHSSPLSKSKSHSPSPLKRVKSRTIEKQVVVVRRSSRVANMPAPVYKEVVIDRVVTPRSRRYGGSYDRYRDYSKRVYASDEARQEALDKADKIQSDLQSKSHHPSFVKTMLQSHVTGGFWLGLSVQFCKTHLPNRDERITLIDEDGDEYETLYLARKTGLSAGWRGFSIAHNLVDGDALVFELISRTTFKVYIIRVNSPAEGEEQ
ncbi:B3 domain-containing protein At5g42700 [Arachis duranensis]|uniref:B3 domain-containing protein At5g42700 n=1 Tax=Arachis duranensis TaxID=130453 RepID=A0A6P4C074_ARADU|nr:B3 domain-containing protein At5g42700 [Arachis duranensis]